MPPLRVSGAGRGWSPGGPVCAGATRRLPGTALRRGRFHLETIVGAPGQGSRTTVPESVVGEPDAAGAEIHEIQQRDYSVTKFDDEKTRQGRRGTPVLMILIAALALCVVVFIGVQIYGASQPDSSIEAGPETTGEPPVAGTAGGAAEDDDATVVAPSDGDGPAAGTGSN